MPHRDGLLHISEIAWERLDDMEASGLKEGDKVQVKLIEIDKKTGKYRLSMRALLPKPEGYVVVAEAVALDVHLGGGDAVGCSCHLEVHVAEVVFVRSTKSKKAAISKWLRPTATLSTRLSP